MRCATDLCHCVVMHSNGDKRAQAAVFVLPFFSGSISCFSDTKLIENVLIVSSGSTPGGYFKAKWATTKKRRTTAQGEST